MKPANLNFINVRHDYQFFSTDRKPFEVNKSYPAECLEKAKKYADNQAEHIVDKNVTSLVFKISGKR